MADEPQKKKRKRNRKRKRNKTHEDLPSNLVRAEDFNGIDPVDLMGYAAAEIEEEQKGFEEFAGQSVPGMPGASPGPSDVNDVVPPDFWVLPEIDNGEFQQYQFTLAVSKVAVGAIQIGKQRTSEVVFTCRIAVTHYYLVDIKGGAKRPALSYMPITEAFDIRLPQALLPSTFRKNPDDLSPKASADILMGMFNQMKWEQLRPAPKSDEERLLPENIMRMMGKTPTGGS